MCGLQPHVAHYEKRILFGKDRNLRKRSETTLSYNKEHHAPMANVDNDVTPSFRVTPSCILIVSLWLVVVLCPPINVLKLPTLTSVYLCE